MINHHSKIIGLTQQEVKKAHAVYGYNEIPEKKHTLFGRIFKKLHSPISLMMEAAFMLSFFAGKWEDGVIIASLMLINISVDVIQETKASKALAAIRNTLSPTATVLRDSAYMSLPTRELVPGDIVKLAGGDIVPADACIIDETPLSVDQSSVTGESLPVEKKKGETLLSSTIVQRGTALVKVTATGSKATIGKSIELVDKASEDTDSDFQRAIFSITRFLVVLSLVIAGIVLIFLIHRGDPLIETVRFALVLIVASIPVALPTVLSVTLALGARKLAEHKAVVSNLRAIEALAGVDQLCVDKTGTLTQNLLTIANPKQYGEITTDTLITYALIASDEGYKSPIEKAVHTYAQEHHLLDSIASFTIKTFVPFDPRTKVTKSLVTDEQNQTFEITMGAPQVIARDITDTQLRKQFEKDITDFARDGFKTIGIVRKDGAVVMPVGIIPLLDPPRDDAKQLIKDINEKGVQIRMITGDSTPIARYVGNLLGIGSRILDHVQLSALIKKTKGTAHDHTKDTFITSTDIFSEVTPEDKYHIVESLRVQDHLVAMTGDGVNDAPALKRANIGFAVSNATDAARSAADVALFDGSLSVINMALGYARVIFARMQAYATFRISETIRIIFFVAISIVVYNITPVTAVMIILIALINDIPVMAIAYDNAVESKTPIRWHLKETLIISTVLGLAGLLSSFLFLAWVVALGIPLAIMQTLIFLKLDVAGHSTLYLTRTGHKHFWKRPFPSLKFFIPAFGSRIIGTLIAYYGIFMTPISIGQIVIVWIYALIWFLFNDQVKVFAYKILDYIARRRGKHIPLTPANTLHKPQTA